MIEYRCSETKRRKNLPVGGVRKDEIVMKYSEAGLNDLREVMLFLRKRQGDLVPLDINLEGLEEAVRQLPKTTRKNVEKFFLVAHSPFQRYCEVNSNFFAWLKKPPDSIVRVAQEANRGALLLQELRFAQLYDKNVEELCDNAAINQGKDGIKRLEIYLTLIKGGSNFFFDQEEKTKEVETEIIDMVSILSKWRESKPLRLEIVGEWEENFLFSDEKRRLDTMFSYRIPISSGGGGRENPITFKNVKKLKKDLFPRGPWETVEALVEGRILKVAGLATLRRQDSYEWRHSYDQRFYERVGEKTLPNGETIPLYRVRGVRSSFAFTDIGEVLFLDHLYERGYI